MTKLARVLATTLGIGAMASASSAYAFNPQPDPPARIRKSANPGDTKLNKVGKTSIKASAGGKVTVSPGPCRDKCGSSGAMSPGLLDNGGTALGPQGPSATGVAPSGAGAAGRSGPAAIR